MDQMRKSVNQLRLLAVFQTLLMLADMFLMVSPVLLTTTIIGWFCIMAQYFYCSEKYQEYENEKV